MNYLKEKIKSTVKGEYYKTINDAVDRSFIYLTTNTVRVIKNNFFSHFSIKLNLDVGENIEVKDLTKVLELIDSKMGTSKFFKNSYITRNGERVLSPSANYFVFFPKLNAFMNVKGIPYEDSDYSGDLNKVNIYFWGKGAYRLMRIFVNTINPKVTLIVSNNKDSQKIMCINMVKYDDKNFSWEKNVSVVKTLDTIYLEQTTKDKLFNYLDKFIIAKGLFSKIDISYKVGILLYGPPGTGKSSISKLIAHYLNAPLYVVDMSLFNTNAINQIRKLPAGTLKIVLFEDIDYIFGKRQNERTPEEKANANALLQLLDGVTTISNVVFIATTNDLDSLDPAIVRDGRFDLKIHMDNIDQPLAEDMVRGIGINNPDAVQEILSPMQEKYNPANIQNRTIQYIFSHIEDIDSFIDEPVSEAEDEPASIWSVGRDMSA